MKRTLLAIALCLATTAAFPQESTVKQVESLIKKKNANLLQARHLIQNALNHPQTQNQAKTWYVAGLIEEQLFSAERTKELMGRQANSGGMYHALLSTLPYMQKAIELEQQPDAQGRLKQTYTKKIRQLLAANHPYYLNAAQYYTDNKDHAAAYHAAEQYLAIAAHPLFSGGHIAQHNLNWMKAQFDAAVAATKIPDHPKAIVALNRAKTTRYRQHEIYQYLYQEYEALQDNDNMEKTVKEALALFPQDSWFTPVLVNRYLDTNRNEDAIACLNQAIAADPSNPQWHIILGDLYESRSKNSEAAEKHYFKALEAAPDDVAAHAALGRLYFNQAINMQDHANTLNDNLQYQQAIARAKSLFEKALPYFRLAHEKQPKEKNYLFALRSIYYQLDMPREFEEIEARLNQ